MEKKTTKSIKSTKPGKVVKVDDKIKKEVKEEKEEKDNKKIIIIALILALVVALFAYWQISKSEDKNENKPINNNEVVDKEEEQISDEEETKTDLDSNFIDYVKEQIKPVKVEKEEEVYYSISFETNGGNIIDKQILTKDEITTLVLPLKENWVFQGWYKDVELTEAYTFGNVLTEDITVYAKWGKYVTYISDEAIYEKEIIVSENEVIPFLEEEKIGKTPEGYVLGWFIDKASDSGEIISSTEIFGGTLLTEAIYSQFDNEEIILTAKYLEKFNVEFFENENAVEALHVEAVVEGRTIPFEQAGLIVKEKFADIEDFGWYYLDENSIKWNVSANQKADKIITRLYLDETYTLIYTEEPDDDTIITEEDKLAPNGNIILKEENVSKDSQIKEEDIFKPLQKEGYEFIGWFLVDELTGETTEEMFTEETIIDGNKLYVAKWKEIILEEVLDENTENLEEPKLEEIIPEEDAINEVFEEEVDVVEDEQTSAITEEIVEETLIEE